MKFPTLKTILINHDKQIVAVSFNINVRHLIVGLILPEYDSDVQYAVTRSNLQPYELAVNQFLANDYLYDQMQVNDPQEREISNLNILNPNHGVGFTPIIVSYLEFPNP